MTTNNQQTTRPNPFGSSRSSSSSGNNVPGRRLSPFGRMNLEWSVIPLEGEAVRISLEGLGDPFHRILGKPLNKDYGKAESIIEALEKDQSLHDELLSALDESWSSYEFSGAAMLYPWSDELKRVYHDFVYPLPPQPEKTNDDESDETFGSDDDAEAESTPEIVGQKLDVSCIRAIDPAFVLNVLARSRSNIVVATTPLALESGFLKPSYVCDDPRIVSIARATGYIEEKW